MANIVSWPGGGYAVLNGTVIHFFNVKNNDGQVASWKLSSRKSLRSICATGTSELPGLLIVSEEGQLFAWNSQHLLNKSTFIKSSYSTGGMGGATYHTLQHELQTSYQEQTNFQVEFKIKKLYLEGDSFDVKSEKFSRPNSYNILDVYVSLNNDVIVIIQDGKQKHLWLNYSLRKKINYSLDGTGLFGPVKFLAEDYATILSISFCENCFFILNSKSEVYYLSTIENPPRLPFSKQIWPQDASLTWVECLNPLSTPGWCTVKLIMDQKQLWLVRESTTQSELRCFEPNYWIVGSKFKMVYSDPHEHKIYYLNNQEWFCIDTQAHFPNPVRVQNFLYASAIEEYLATAEEYQIVRDQAEQQYIILWMPGRMADKKIARYNLTNGNIEFIS